MGKPGHDSEQRSLARAVFTEDDVQLAGNKFSAHAAQRCESAELLDQRVSNDGVLYITHGNEPFFIAFCCRVWRQYPANRALIIKTCPLDTGRIGTPHATPKMRASSPTWVSPYSTYLNRNPKS